MSQVPFTETGRGVPALFAQFGQRYFLGIKAVRALGAQRAEDAHAHIVATGQQSRARSAAHRLGHVKVRKLPTLLRHAVKVRRGIRLGAKRPDIRISHVVHKNDHDIGRVGVSFGRKRNTAPGSQHQEKHPHGWRLAAPTKLSIVEPFHYFA